MCKVCETAERADKARARAAHPSGGLREVHDYFNAVVAYHIALIDGQRLDDEANSRDDAVDVAVDAAVQEAVDSLMRAGLLVVVVEEPPF